MSPTKVEAIQKSSEPRTYHLEQMPCSGTATNVALTDPDSGLLTQDSASPAGQWTPQTVIS
jgi:hypothetical protein